MNTRWAGLAAVSSVFLRLALGISFLSAVADRFGFWGVYGQPNVAWGNYAQYVAYTAKLNWFLPAATIPALAIIATAAEILLGLLLVLGWKTRTIALLSGVLLTTFALAMTLALGVKAPLDFSVFSAAGGALLLATSANFPLSFDELVRRNRQAESIAGGGVKSRVSMETRAHCGRLLIIAVMLVGIPSSLWAHGVVGQRMFIEPLFTEDANIKDELHLPRAEFLMLPDRSSRSFGASFEKALYPNRWSVVIEQSRVYRRVAGSTIAGFDDLEIGTKLVLYRSAEHELVLTPALFLTAPTGSPSVAEHHTQLHPALVIAKGFGDLKWGWLRPLALQGDIGYEVAVTGERDRHATYDMVLEYSVPYLNRSIRNADTRFDLEHNLRLAHSLRAILRNMYPFVEFNGSTPVGGTSGSSATFLRPGAAYVGKYFQISAAADVPLRGYLPSRRIGAVVLFDLFLNEVVPAFGWTPFHKHHHHGDEH